MTTVTIVAFAAPGSYAEAAGFGAHAYTCDGWREALATARYYRDGGRRVHVHRPDDYYGYPLYRPMRIFAGREPRGVS